MTPSRLTTPAPVELVPADEMMAFIAEMDAEFQALEIRAAEANAAADHAEDRVRTLGLDDARAPVAMAALQRFLDDWRARVDAEVQTITDAAHLGARVRIDAAHADAARLRQQRHRTSAASVVAWPSSVAWPSAVAPPPVPAPVALTVEPSHEVPLTPPPIVESAFVASPPLVVPSNVAPAPATPETWPPVADDRAAVQQVVDAPEVAPPPLPAPSVVQVAPPIVETEPAAEEASSFGVPFAPTPGVVEPQAATNGASVAEQTAPEFWPVTPEPTRSRWRRIPISAVLEVIAVLLVLVFILLRLS